MHGNADGLSRKPGDDTDSMVDRSLKNTEQSSPSYMQVGSASLENQSDEAINLVPLQEEDDEPSVVRSWVENDKKPKFNDISSESYVLKSFWSQFRSLELRYN